MHGRWVAIEGAEKQEKEKRRRERKNNCLYCYICVVVGLLRSLALSRRGISDLSSEAK